MDVCPIAPGARDSIPNLHMHLATITAHPSPGGDYVWYVGGGVAEAGALVIVSSPEHPPEANFLAATHIVIVHANRLVDTFEGLWARLRGDYPEALPRTLNLIVGPSRTADLGVPSRLGAHGPARVHIIVVDP